MSESTKTDPEGNDGHRQAKRVEGQATLSAIGDVSIAATDAVNRPAAAPGRTRWLPIFGFLLLAYIAGSLVSMYTHKSPPWVQVFVAPLALVSIATLMFWRRQVWKFRARRARFLEKAQHDRLNSFAHETANGLNAIRANLTGFGEANSPASAAEHGKQVEQALARIEAALSKALVETPPQQAPGSKAAADAAKSKAA